MATRPQSSPRAAGAHTPRPPQGYPYSGQPPSQLQERETEPFTPDPSLFQPETEADRVADAQLSLHGPEVEISDKIYNAIFLSLASIQSSFSGTNKIRVSLALAQRIHGIIDYTDLHQDENPVGLRTESIRRAIEESLEWEVMGIPKERQVKISEGIFEQVCRVLPPIKNLLT